MNPNNILQLLKKHQVTIDKPLTPVEIEQIEERYKIVFPPDLRDLYLCGLPMGRGFINWRETSEENIKSIKNRLEWPLDGMLFDIENNSFWFAEWGERPAELQTALQICKDKLKEVPKLIPVFSHRFIPSFPHERNNPIFSVYQTDIIYYGENLGEYFKVEYNEKDHSEIQYDEIIKINFWSELL